MLLMFFAENSVARAEAKTVQRSKRESVIFFINLLRDKMVRQIPSRLYLKYYFLGGGCQSNWFLGSGLQSP